MNKVQLVCKKSVRDTFTLKYSRSVPEFVPQDLSQIHACQCPRCYHSDPHSDCLQPSHKFFECAGINASLAVGILKISHLILSVCILHFCTHSIEVAVQEFVAHLAIHHVGIIYVITTGL